ncbi:MAG: hypothetical protein H6716_20450 [Polyangiaceae bacterium]|nr:hypothetical protein [Polyangiaceae bacterium]
MRPHPARVPPPDMRHANAEPYLMFRRFIDRFDTAVKVATSAIQDMQTGLASAGALPASVVVNATPWAPKVVAEPQQTVVSSLHTLSSLWVVEALAAFEHYLVRVHATLTRWTEVSRATPAPGLTADPDGKIALGRLYDAYGWSKESVSPYLPTLEYLQTCRNCMVHRAGVVSDALSKRQLPEGYADEWPKIQGNAFRAPSFPEAKANDYLALEPRHSIFAIALCNRLAKDVNQRLVRELGLPGLIHHAAHHVLLADEPVPIEREYLARRHAPNDAIAHMLDSRYTVRHVPPAEVSRILRELGVWSRIPKLYAPLVDAARHVQPARRTR